MADTTRMKRGAIVRIVPPNKIKHFKRQGYEIDEIKEESKQDLRDKYTVEELKELAKENSIKSYWNMKEDTLIESLQEIDVI